MVIEPIMVRRSIREYSDEPVLEGAIEDLIRAAKFAPSAMGNKAIEAIVIKKQSVKDDLQKVLEQDFIGKAPVLLLFVSDTDKSIFSDFDLAIASGFAMVQASSLGLGTVWKNVGLDKKKSVRKIIGIPENFNFINIIPVGYPLNDLADHSDDEIDFKKIHQDVW
jgi:nitroreductase